MPLFVSWQYSKRLLHYWWLLEKSAFFVVITLGRLIMVWCVSTVGCPLGQHCLDLLSCIRRTWNAEHNGWWSSWRGWIWSKYIVYTYELLKERIKYYSICLRGSFPSPVLPTFNSLVLFSQYKTTLYLTKTSITRG